MIGVACQRLWSPLSTEGYAAFLLQRLSIETSIKRVCTEQHGAQAQAPNRLSVLGLRSETCKRVIGRDSEVRTRERDGMERRIAQKSSTSRFLISPI